MRNSSLRHIEILFIVARSGKAGMSAGRVLEHTRSHPCAMHGCAGMHACSRTKKMARPAAEFLQATGALRQLRRLGVATRSCYGARHQHQSTPSPARRPSPYRLLQPHAFLAEFAPLHVNGWRVDALENAEKLLEADRVEEVLDGAQAMEKGDLQGRRLVRVFELGEGKEGWRRLIKFVGQVGQVIEDQDVC